MHKFSRTYKGADDFINNWLAHISSHFVDFKVDTGDRVEIWIINKDGLRKEYVDLKLD